MLEINKTNRKILPVLRRYIQENPNKIDHDSLIFAMPDFEMVELLLEHGANPNLIDNGKFPLMFALKDMCIFEMLLQYGADINLQNNEGVNILMYAIMNGRNIERILKGGVDINHVNSNGYTALMLAMEQPQMKYITKAVKLLLSYGAKDSFVDHNHHNALMIFLAKYHRQSKVEVAKLLLDSGSNINQENNLGNTPLMIACYYESNDIDIIKILLENDANVNHTNSKGDNALLNMFSYYRWNNVEDQVRLLIQYGIDINHRNHHGMSALMASIEYAVEEGENTIKLLLYHGASLEGVVPPHDNIPNLESIKALIQYGYNIDQANSDGQTLLMIVCDHKQTCYDDRLGVVNFILENNADVNLCDDQGWSALMYAVRYVERCLDEPDPKIVKTLLKYGAKIYGSILVAAIETHEQYSNRRIIKLLLKYGADINETNEEGVSILIQATKHPKYSRLKFLLDHGANVNWRDHSGNCALAYLIKNNASQRIIELFFKYGQDINIKNNNGDNLLMIAAKQGFDIGYLLDKGADVNCVNRDGKTVIGLVRNVKTAVKIIAHSLNHE